MFNLSRLFGRDQRGRKYVTLDRHPGQTDTHISDFYFIEENTSPLFCVLSIRSPKSSIGTKTVNNLHTWDIVQDLVFHPRIYWVGSSRYFQLTSDLYFRGVLESRDWKCELGPCGMTLRRNSSRVRTRIEGGPVVVKEEEDESRRPCGPSFGDSGNDPTAASAPIVSFGDHWNCD